MPENEGFDQRPPLPQRSGVPFYKNPWFWVATVVVLILVGTEASSLLTKGRPQSSQQASQPAGTQEAQTAQIPIQVTTQASPNNATQDLQQQSSTVDTARDDKINQLIKDGKLVQAKDARSADSLLKEGQAALIGKDLIVNLEGYRIEVDQYPFREYVVVDFSIVNLSGEDYLSSLSDFTLRSDSGRTYSPSFGAHTAGDIEGVINNNDMRRGEIAFEAPITQDVIANHPYSNLEYSNSLEESPQIIAYLIDLSKAPQTLGQ